MKVYLAGAISDKDAKNGQIETVRKLRRRGVEDMLDYVGKMVK